MLGFVSNRDPIGKYLRRVDWWRHRWRHVPLWCHKRDVTIFNVVAFINQYPDQPSVWTWLLILQYFIAITACAVETSCCISDKPSQWERANFDPHSSGIYWPIVLKLTFKKHVREASHMPNFVKLGIRVWVGRTPSLSQFWFYPLFFLFFVCVSFASRPGHTARPITTHDGS